MKVCGVEFVSNEANICLMSLEKGMFELPICRARKLSISDIENTSQLIYFQKEFVKLMHDYQVEHVVIKKRPTKGKFAGSAAGFKMEAALQLATDLKVTLLEPTDIKSITKEKPIPIFFKETGLKGFQENAFLTAYAFLVRE